MQNYILVIISIYSLFTVSVYSQTRNERIDELNNTLSNNQKLTQSDMNNIAAEIYRLTNEEMIERCKKVTNEYQDDNIFIKKFNKAQKAWIIFRNAHIDSIYPEENKQYCYGSIFPMCYYMELTEITRERIKQLSPWIDGIKEGDCCSGSRKFKQ